MIVLARNYLEDREQRKILDLTRVGLYVILLCVGIFAYLYQRQFIDWRLMQGLLLGLVVAFAVHLIQIGTGDFFLNHPRLLYATYIFDSLLMSGMVYQSGIQQALVLFFFLINILLCGFGFRLYGALVLAGVSCLSFTLVALLSPDIKTPNQILVLALNNLSFYAVAILAGYISQQVELTHENLQTTGQTLRSTEALSSEIISHMPVGLVTFDQSGSIYQANQIFSKIVGQNVVTGENLFQFFPETRSIFSEFRNILPQGRGTIDLSYKNQKGEQLVLVLNSGSFLHESLNKQIYILLIEDITRLRELEFSLRQNEKMAAIGGLAAGIAHEIRNPLASISGSIELLSSNVVHEEDGRLMKIILREIDRLNNLIGEFLEYSRPEKAPDEKVDLVSLVSEILDFVKLDRKLDPKESVRQHRQLPETAIITGNRNKLKQALLNMIINSYQAQKKDGSEMEDPPEVRILIKQEASFWVLEIEDNGCGMSKETQQRMFEPFHTTKPKGTGLGLAVTHKILEAHRVQLFVKSELGKGTLITLKFPLF